MANQLGSLSPWVSPRVGMYSASVEAVLSLKTCSFLTPEETAQALDFDAKQQEFQARMADHTWERAGIDAEKLLEDYAEGRSTVVPPTAEQMRERYHHIVNKVKETFGEYTKASGIQKFCVPILRRAYEGARDRYEGIMMMEKPIAEALGIPYEPSENALAAGRACDVLHQRSRNIDRDFEGIGLELPFIRNLLQEFVNWPDLAHRHNY